MRWTIFLLGAALLAGCDGTNENAGEVADADAGTAQAVGEGPNERLGESLDRARQATEASVEAQAELIRDQADVRADQLEDQADRLEDQADAVRKQAKEAAGAIEDRTGQ
jgi:hypothetical protein